MAVAWWQVVSLLKHQRDKLNSILMLSRCFKEDSSCPGETSHILEQSKSIDSLNSLEPGAWNLVLFVVPWLVFVRTLYIQYTVNFCAVYASAATKGFQAGGNPAKDTDMSSPNSTFVTNEQETLSPFLTPILVQLDPCLCSPA